MVIHVGDETRTTNYGTSTLWEEDDKLTVIHSAPGGSDFLASRFTKNPGENSFTGKVKGLSAANDWYVVYPYQEDNMAADQLSFTFPASQNQAGNASMAHLAGPSFPLVAKYLNLDRSSQLNVTMENVLHVLEFDFENKTESGHSVKVKEVQFTATSPIAGVFNVDLTGDDPVLTAESGATKVVKLGVTDGASISAGGTSKFYMAIAPFTAPAGSKLKVKVTALDTVTEETIVFYRIITAGDNGIIFSSGTIQPIGVEFDEKNSQDPDAGSAGEVELEPGEQPEDGVYLLVYENGENSLAFAPMADQQENNYAIPVTVENGVVISQEGQDLSIYAVRIENTGNKHACDDNAYAYNVINSQDYYIFYSENVLRIEESNLYTNSQGSANYYYHTFVQAEDGIQIRSAQNSSGAYQYLLTYSDAKGFHYSRDESDQGKKLHLYLLGGSVKEKQNPYFDPDTVTYNLDDDEEFQAPTLKDLFTSVTSWTSSDPAVATVDENGIVTICEVGSTIITANVSSSDVYSGATPSYTITVTMNPREPQVLSFDEESIIWTIGENGFELNGSNDFPQTVKNAKTSPVVYESSKTSVAQIIDNNKIKIIGTGQATITAKAPRDKDYEAGEASYTLIIREQLPDDFVDFGTINLENDDVKSFLDNGVNDYTNDNYTGTSPVTHVATYAYSVPTYSSGVYGESLVKSEDRIDVPDPVHLYWTNASVGEATVSIYSQQTLADDDLVWSQSTTVGSTSADVYNLVPGETYYCSVVDTNGDYLLKGKFTTIGRRRMIRLSDRDGKYDRGNNFRDLGGMVTADGKKRIKYGWIYRGTNVNGTNDDEKAVMTDYLNIGWDIDLRGSSEGSAAFASGSGVNYVMCNYQATINDLTRDNSKVKKTVQAFIDAAKAGKASFFHCRIGSDRTGYWGLVIEGLLGVSPRDCSIDYELTSFANGVTSGNRTRTSGLYKDGMDFFKKKSYYNGDLEYTITYYLTQEIGITAEDITIFKGLVLESI